MKATVENTHFQDLATEQLRLENLWLRQQLHGRRKLVPMRRKPVLRLESERGCQCDLCARKPLDGGSGH